MVNFWANVKSQTFHNKLLWLLLGNFWKKIGNFLTFHLVTLLSHVVWHTLVARMQSLPPFFVWYCPHIFLCSYVSLCSHASPSSSMWPDLAKISPLSQKFKWLWQFVKGLFSIWEIFSLLWQMSYATGLIFIVENGPIS